MIMEERLRQTEAALDVYDARKRRRDIYQRIVGQFFSTGDGVPHKPPLRPTD